MPGIEAKLKELGIELPTPVAPVANYVPFVITGTQLVVSGQVSMRPDKTMITGKLGGGVSEAEGREAARVAAINVLAQVKAALGSLDRVARVVRLGGFINATPDFAETPKIMNGASDLMVEVFGEAGRHARSTVGVAVLPMNVAVEVEGLFEIA